MSSYRNGNTIPYRVVYSDSTVAYTPDPYSSYQGTCTKPVTASTVNLIEPLQSQDSSNYYKAPSLLQQAATSLILNPKPLNPEPLNPSTRKPQTLDPSTLRPRHELTQKLRDF